MASTDELRTAVRETLESRGVLQQLKAQARAGVFSALDNQQREERRELPEETMVINKLIKDYLQFNGYNYTRSVFVAESGEAKEEVSTEFLAQEMGLSSPVEDSSIPLLYQMMAHLKRKKRVPSNKPHPPATLSSSDAPPTHTHHQGNNETSKQTSTKQATDPNHPPMIVMEGTKLS